MIAGHGRLIMMVMALVMATAACSVEFNGQTYPLSDAPATETPAASPAPAVSSMTPPAVMECLLVNALPGADGTLNLRSGPGTSYPVMAVLTDGQSLVMAESSGSWYRVDAKLDGVSMTGWVNSVYVEACP